MNENLYAALCSLFADSDPLPLLNSTSEYRVFRKLIAEANSVARAWFQEPDVEAAASLRKNLFSAWQECHQWLLGEMKSKALWSPEWLGWLAYTSLYVPEFSWQSFSFSFLLLDRCLEKVPADLSSENQKYLYDSLGRLASMVSDESAEPLLLPPLQETALLNNLSLTEIKADSERQGTPDRLSSDNLSSLQSLAGPLEKLPGHFNRFGRTIHLRKFRSVINDAIAVLSQCVPSSQCAESEMADCEGVSDCSDDDAMSATSPERPKTMNRDYARDSLQELITFFRQTEPHSPVAWQLETALNWLNLSFPELLLKMTGEQQELYQDICRRLGMIDAVSIGEKSDE
ncbi:hypothetical protein [Endozoicomonas atrinae]|uniref:hypothetical protein n=1 Tax=Endozoicomonas atrinae TaxID=1333660 RepID=UPI001112D1F6|nr:hypothetical protein [Endozoicomonas atrinae]